MDKVSIIVPVFNVEKYLHRTLSSLVGQTYENLEILVIDDGSSDGSCRIIEDFAQKDTRIRLLRQKENQGVCAARNRGLDAATGEWICFCDGDDWYVPEFVQTMLERAKRETADYVICNYRVVGQGRLSVVSDSLAALESGCDPRIVIACGPLASCTHMVSRRLFTLSRVRYPVGLRQYEELPVMPVLAKYAARIAVCHQPLYCYYQRGNASSASNGSGESEENFRRALAAMGDALGAGYEQEMEFHAIYALFYGEILNACKRGEPTKGILERIDRYRREYPRWQENPYFDKLGRSKQIFLRLVFWRWVTGLRGLAWIHGKIVN